MKTCESEPRNPFAFATCQAGAETALKAEVAQLESDVRAAFSRPGFVTFKLPAGYSRSSPFHPNSVFAQTTGWSLGSVHCDSTSIGAAQVWDLVQNQRLHHLHTWQRNSRKNPLNPVTPLASAIGQQLLAGLPSDRAPLPLNQIAQRGQQVLDCVLVEPGEWWIGSHVANKVPSRWPGGVIHRDLPAHAVSRAYLKMWAALQWSGISIAPGDRCVELGSAPGGSSQALLDRGVQVTGIDPAEMDETVLAHPDFTHLRMRGADLKRRAYRSFRWLVADANVAPKHTLDTVEQIVTYPGVPIRGLLLPLKLLQWNLAAQVPAWMERIRSWGYRHVRARQLASGGQEICIAAMRHRSLKRVGGPRRS